MARFHGDIGPWVPLCPGSLVPGAWGPVRCAAQALTHRLATAALGPPLPNPHARAGAPPTVRSLQGNALQGSLPASWAAASSLRVLLLDDNRLNGSLGAAGVPAGVRRLGLRGNAFEGELPPSLSKSPNLRRGAGLSRALCFLGPAGFAAVCMRGAPQLTSTQPASGVRDSGCTTKAFP
jgi:hypothetical protein